MKFRELHYRFVWRLQSPPEKLWPLVTDTNRFNRDTGLPVMITDGMDPDEPTVRRMHLNYHGLTIKWREYPFDWIKPHQFGVVRRYLNGPVQSLRMVTRLNDTEEGGTELDYQVWVLPRNILGRLITPLQVGVLSRIAFGKAFLHYDSLVAGDKPVEEHPFVAPERLPSGGRRRCAAICERLSRNGSCKEAVVDRLEGLIEKADDLSLMRMRPYAFADIWKVPRRITLDLFLHAARQGLLDFSWEVLCPLCRGSKATVRSLRDLEKSVHCDACNISFEANFDQAVELVFQPNQSVRKIEIHDYCVGGPQVTPHIVAQVVIKPQDFALVTPDFEPGRYRLRAHGVDGGTYFNVRPEGESSLEISLTEDGWPNEEHRINSSSTIRIANESGLSRMFIIEHMSWMDQAATAAQVTARQTFRDLFSSEVLSLGEQISVGSITLVFTDLKGSTSLYESIGDAPAFSLVMNHFNVLKKQVAENNGAIVKNMGDAIMAAFVQPLDAVKSMLAAQRELADPAFKPQPLMLKVGIHTGPSIAINQDERLDYFGTTVNMTARLEGLSDGRNLILSDKVAADHEVRTYLENKGDFEVERDTAHVKGITQGPIAFVRVKQPLP